jgi:hypothetical protein
MRRLRADKIGGMLATVRFRVVLSSRLLSRNLKVKMYKTVILPVVLYECETWSVTLREEQRLRVFENRVVRRIFGPKRDEVTTEWRKLHNEELYNLYSSPDIIRQVKSRRMRWAGHVARMVEKRKVYEVLVGKPEGKKPLGRPKVHHRTHNSPPPAPILSQSNPIQTLQANLPKIHSDPIFPPTPLNKYINKYINKLAEITISFSSFQCHKETQDKFNI